MRSICHLGKTGLLLGLLLSVVTAALADIQVQVNGQTLVFSVPPYQTGGRTMVPLRGIFEALGARVDWQESTQSITASKGNDTVQLSIGQTTATVNGTAVQLDVPAMVDNGSTMVPLRFVSEALGAEVKWFEASQTVKIYSRHGGMVQQPTVNVQGIPSSAVCNLVAPIALYPDPLLAIMLPAATFPDQVEACAHLNLGDDEAAIDRQNWDVSVKCLAHYPRLYRRMAEDMNWTIALGQCYVSQPQYLMYNCQLMRRHCRDNGILISNPQERIYMEGDYVRIVPAESNEIYVPEYDPSVVYTTERHNDHALISFGAGLSIGVWLCNDTDWGHNRVYNHGWQGSGWVAASRPHVTENNTTINNIYITNVNQPVMVNREIVSRQVNMQSVKTYSLPPTITTQSQTFARQHSITTIAPRQMSHPAMTHPGMATRQMTQPATTHPGMAPQQMAHPAMSQPGKAPRQMTHPAMSHPGKAPQQMTHPAMSHPGMAPRQMKHPAMSHPGKAPQQMTHPAMSHPGMAPRQMKHPAMSHPGKAPQQMTNPAMSHPGKAPQPTSHLGSRPSAPSHQTSPAHSMKSPSPTSHPSSRPSAPSHQSAPAPSMKSPPPTSHSSSRPSAPSHQSAPAPSMKSPPPSHPGATQKAPDKKSDEKDKRDKNSQ